MGAHLRHGRKENSLEEIIINKTMITLTILLMISILAACAIHLPPNVYFGTLSEKVTKPYRLANRRLNNIYEKEAHEEKEIFHGGCVPCDMQARKGISYCVGCQYFETNWDLPDLNLDRIREDKRQNGVRNKARKQYQKNINKKQ